MGKSGLSSVSLLLAAVFFLGSCGAGTAGIIAGANDDGGSDGATVTIEILDQKAEPATVRLKSSRAVTVDLVYRKPNGARTRFTRVGPVELEANTPEDVPWNFKTDLNDPTAFPSPTLYPDISVFTVLEGRIGMEPALAETEDDFGNEPPVIEVVDFPASSEEVAGVVPIGLKLSDSTGDVVDVFVDFQIDGESEWTPARPAGQTPAPKDPSLKGIEAPAGKPRDVIFFWDTDFDLRDLEHDVRLRFRPDDRTPDEATRFGMERQTEHFRVDNNEEPIVLFDSGPLASNSDDRRGIPVPYRVIDEDPVKGNDTVETIFQWKRQFEEFPPLDLDTDPRDGVITDEEIQAIGRDPAARAERHICTPYPTFATGLIVEPSTVSSVRLPELARSMSGITVSGLVGRRLEILRPSSIPEPVAQQWGGANPLATPVAAVPRGDGLNALVLDLSCNNWCLREVVLATGRVEREIASGSGMPSAMCLERGERAVLVASRAAGDWQIERVDLGDSTTSPSVDFLVASDGTVPGLVRGIASLGEHAAVFTVGSSLFHLAYPETVTPTATRLLEDLDEPWGVAVDPLTPSRLYVCENQAKPGRVLSIDLGQHDELPVALRAEGLPTPELDDPEALAIERSGSRLLIVTGAPGSDRQLNGLDLGAQGKNALHTIGRPFSGGSASVSVGPDGLRLLAVPDTNELLVAGGIEQRLTINAYAKNDQVTTVNEAFDPIVQSGRIWRISAGAEQTLGIRSLKATATGVDEFFVWDSSADLPGGGPAFLRALARDDEIGLAVEGAAPKQIRSSLDVEPVSLGGQGTTDAPVNAAIGDLDGDGDLDLASANQDGNDVTIFLQTSPGVFGLQQPSLDAGRSPQRVAIGDLDRDGDLDIVSSSRDDFLRIYTQSSPGTFMRLENDLPTGGDPVFVAIGDLDGDGGQDLVAVNNDRNSVPIPSDNLKIFFQGDLPGFDSTQDPSEETRVLGGLNAAQPTRDPESVAIGDLDKDGDLDLVTANSGSGSLRVFWQDSFRDFTRSSTFPVRDPEFVAVGDVDGDGAQDIVAVIGGDKDGSLTVLYQGDADDSFESIPVLGDDEPLLLGPESVALGDLDGDSDLDLVSSNQEGNNLTVFYQEAPRVFGPALELGGLLTTIEPKTVSLGDLDGDGDLDLVSANEDEDDGIGSNLTLFFQRTTGFAPALILGGDPLTDDPASLAIGDLDGDGVQDLITSNRGGENLTVFVQDPPGSFAFRRLIGSEDETVSPVFVALGDLDGDGDLDLVSANQGDDLEDDDDKLVIEGDNLTVFEQTSPGTFAEPEGYGGSGMTDIPVFVAIADLDSDGRQDFISANKASANLTVFSRTNVSKPFSANPLPSPSVPRSVAIGDLDGDGDLDFVSANRDRLPTQRGNLDGVRDVDVGQRGFPGNNLLTSNLAIYLQQESGGFVFGPTLGDFRTTQQPSFVAIGDLDGDGDPDLVSANEGGDDLSLFFQTAPGSFEFDRNLFGSIDAPIDDPSAVAIGDLDADGDLDIASSNQNSDNVTIFFQSRLGAFLSPPLALGNSTVSDLPEYVVINDLDGDGDQDVVSSNLGDSRNVTIFFGGR